jgi:hypothetical protein
MPALTRKRVYKRPETWHVHYAGVCVGVICERWGAPPTSAQWEWCCGINPGSNPGDDRHGTAASFETARAAFEAAWRDYLPKLTEADFQEWRDQEARTERKYAMRATGERLPSRKPSSLMTCHCGEVFDSHRLEHTLVHVPHIVATFDNETRH